MADLLSWPYLLLLFLKKTESRRLTADLFVLNPTRLRLVCFRNDFCLQRDLLYSMSLVVREMLALPDRSQLFSLNFLYAGLLINLAYHVCDGHGQIRPICFVTNLGGKLLLVAC
jgi:hypothetical protein